VDYLVAHPNATRYRRRRMYDVALNPSAPILRIESTAMVLDLTAQYGRLYPHIRPGPGTHCLDWAALAAEYAGVAVTAGALARQDRPFLDWIDIDWCIPSACAWRASAVTTMTAVVKTPQLPSDADARDQS